MLYSLEVQNDYCIYYKLKRWVSQKNANVVHLMSYMRFYLIVLGVLRQSCSSKGGKYINKLIMLQA